MTEVSGATGDGARHAWMDSWCATLARVLVGRSARRLLDAGLGENVGLALLPSWAWRTPIADVGRKAKAVGGGTLLLPLQVTWEQGPLVAVGDEPVEVSWTAEGLGFSEEGTCVLYPSQTEGWDVCRLDDSPAVPRSAVVGRIDTQWAGTILTELAGDGETAWWEAVMSMERYVDQAVRRAASHVSMDVGGGLEAPPLLDQVSIDAVTDEMMVLGADGKSRSSVVRIVDHSLQPGVFAKVDPQRYVAQTVHREAQQAVRRRLKDPRSGPRIRLLSRQLGLEVRHDDEAVATILAAYRQQRPNERMGAGRVVAALTVVPEASCRQVSMSVIGELEGVDRWPAAAS